MTTALRDAIDFTALGWVKPELDETLRQARLEIEAYAEDPEDAGRMQACASLLHQVQGSLRMLELYAPAMVGDNAPPSSLRVRRLSLEVVNGMAPNHVVISSGLRRVVLDLAAGEVRSVDFKPGGGVPYKPALYPTNYIYSFSVTTSAGFVPFLEEAGATDSRYLGVKVRVTPVY